MTGTNIGDAMSDPDSANGAEVVVVAVGPLAGEGGRPDVLVQLAMQFEATHFAQIRRHYQSIAHDCDSNTDGQLDLFDEPPPF